VKNPKNWGLSTNKVSTVKLSVLFGKSNARMESVLENLVLFEID
jgi:hypothetical protein